MINFLLGRIKSFRWALKGIADLVSNHPNAQFHLLATAVVIAWSIYFRLSITEWCLVTLAIVLVLGMEAMNSALEYVVDLVSPEHHPLAGKAKDIAAAAVLLCAFGAAVVGCLIFAPKFWGLFTGS